MNGSKAKKIRREIRKYARHEFGDGMAMINRMIRPRPKFVPKLLWAVLLLPLFKVKHLRLIIKYL